MTYPKMLPCPKCGSSMSVYTYETATGAMGSRRAECDNASCWWMGSCEGSIPAAIRAHNQKAREFLAETEAQP